MMRTRFIRVAVPSPLRQTFDYRLPEATVVSAGARVRVPFGRRKLVGHVVETGVRPDIDPDRIREVHEILDPEPLLSDTDLAFLAWVTRYYHHPPGEVFSTALPSLLNKGVAAQRMPNWRWVLATPGMDTTGVDERRAPRQASLLKLLRDTPEGVDEAGLSALDYDWRAPMRALLEKGCAKRIDVGPAFEARAPSTVPRLNAEQRAAVDAVLAARDRFGVHLIEGVTGSGKTEVYLRLAENVIDAGKQVLLLVPEIGLTPQLRDRFRDRLGDRHAALHSSMSDRQRLDAWLDARAGSVDWLVGTRSAVFTPLARPGLIIVDEEHDPSFKQQEGLRYSARDLAMIRARDWGIPVVLGSATPSIESIFRAERGDYTHLVLRKRAGKARPPGIELCDIRNLSLSEGLSEPLLQRVGETLAANRQVLLFLNRRGYAPVLSCHHCGWVAECRHCDARLTVHRGERKLRCHHCGAEQRLEESCPACGSEELIRLGAGTERLEDILESRFDGVAIERIDRDATRRKGELDARLARAHSGDPMILVGTQMIAKGHDFPNVGLVGIVNADDGLFGLDFRSLERVGQLLVQVAGRAGRGDRPGEVIVQTRNPEHESLNMLLREGYGPFARACLAEREMALMPPFAHLALLRADSARAGQAMDFLADAARATRALHIADLQVWGPAHAPMEKRAGRFRAQLLLVHPRRAELHKALDLALARWPGLESARRVRWSLDVDPGELF